MPQVHSSDFSILHIGNILNNGYLHCKYLRRRGIPADSLNVDYRHCQGQPEWAEAFITDPVDEFNPDWSRVDLKGFRRPEWFYDVSLSDIPDLVARLGNGGMAFSQRTAPAGAPAPAYEPAPAPGPARIPPFLKARALVSRSLRSIGLSPLVEAVKTLSNRRMASQLGFDEANGETQVQEWMNEYARHYPDHRPGLSSPDIYEWLPRSLAYAPMLRRYPLIHAYSLDPIYPLLGNPGQPFICYEHGTMREFPFEDSARGRLYSLCLKKAEKVVITNADCNRSAERLGLSNYVFIPHIIDDDLFKPGDSPLRRKLQKEHDCDFIFVAPSRHHWKHCPPGLENSWFKRNDILIRGLGRVFHSHPKLKVLVVFFEWGQEVALSKELIRDCGFSDRVRWEPIQSKPALKEFYNAADIILDQFNSGIGTFGAVVPEAMACAKPVLLNYKKELHTWCYPELPPALNAPDEQAIAHHLGELVESQDYRQKIGLAGRRWFEKYHSSRIVIDRMIDIYKAISEKYGWDWELETEPKRGKSPGR